MRSVAQLFMKPIPAAGASGRITCAPVKAAANGFPAARPSRAAPAIRADGSRHEAAEKRQCSDRARQTPAVVVVPETGDGPDPDDDTHAML
jgi:hypothetical protein